MKQFIRHWVTQTLASLLALKSKPVIPDWSKGQPRILFLRYDRIGDMVITTGILKALKTALPNIQLDVLASKRNAPILDAEDYIDNVIIREPKRLWTLIRRLRQSRYDLVIDYHIYESSRNTMILMLLCGAKHRLGMAGKAVDRIFTVLAPHYLERVHIIRNLANLLVPFGLDPDACYKPTMTLRDLEITRAQSIWQQHAGDTTLLFNVSKTGHYGQWQQANYLACLDHIKRYYPSVSVLIIGIRDQADWVEQIAAQSGFAHHYPETIRDAFALAATADFIFTPDTSIAHAISCFQTPGLAFYTVNEACTWGIYNTAGEVIEGPSNRFKDLPLAPVIAALDRLLQPESAQTKVS